MGYERKKKKEKKFVIAHRIHLYRYLYKNKEEDSQRFLFRIFALIKCPYLYNIGVEKYMHIGSNFAINLFFRKRGKKKLEKHAEVFRNTTAKYVL